MLEKKPTTLNTSAEYYIYTNLNCPNQEDFTFIVTALWHWYQINPFPGLKLVNDPEEITVPAPPDEEKKDDEKKSDAEKKDEKKDGDGENSEASKPEGESQSEAQPES